MKIEALSEENLAGLVALFEASAVTCFCRYWHFQGNKNEWLDRCAHRPEENRAELEASVRAKETSARALLAIEEDGTVVGFMKLVPRSTIPKLRNLSVYRQLDLGDDTTTYSVGCFLVHPLKRKKGIARALLKAAPGFVQKWGGEAVEGYPRRSSVPLYDEEAWQGPEAAFTSTGYEVVHDGAEPGRGQDLGFPPYPVMRVRVRPQD